MSKSISPDTDVHMPLWRIAALVVAILVFGLTVGGAYARVQAHEESPGHALAHENAQTLQAVRITLERVTTILERMERREVNREDAFRHYKRTHGIGEQ